MAARKRPRLIRLAKIASTSRGRRLLGGAKARNEFDKRAGIAVLHQMGGGAPNMKRIRELPRNRAEFERMRSHITDTHNYLSTAYTFLTHGEPLYALSERFIKNLGMTPDQITRPAGCTPPENIRHRKLRPEAMAAEVDALRKRIDADDFIDPDLKRNILGNLGIMKQKGTVGEHWGNIQIVANNSREILEGITDPEVIATAEDAKGHITEVRRSLAAYDRLARELPNSGKFTPEEVAHMYATFHGEGRKEFVRHLADRANER